MTTPNNTALDSKAVAEAIDITPKELRVYLRAIGYEKTDGRYVFTKGDVAKLKKGYAAWVKERAAKKAAKDDAPAAAAEKADDATPPA
ncbi:hypothetical protein [Mycobacterium intracellulare]|uniref:hypothetical protein n=1 Tax=Mycobacterium intracellulare TaxID=1767 RepID=UPI000CE3B8A8|nr:hypothetical protein [Mycobacterium intracellulare]